MLLQVRDYLKREKIASNQQIARVFQIAQSALEPMLIMLLRHGVVDYVEAPASCKQSCTKCHPATVVYYRFRSA